MAAVTQLSIINRARVKAGEETVADLTPVDAMMRAALASYEDIVLDELENSEYLFALKQASPVINATDTTRDLSFQYVIPSDSLGIVGVRYLDQPLEGSLFRIEGDAVWTSFNGGVTFLYKFRPDEASWPRRFVSIIVDELATVFMQGTERHSEARGIQEGAFRKRIIARHAEARQRHNRPIGDGSIVSRRRGGGLEMWTNLPALGFGGSSSTSSTTDNSLADNDVFKSADYTVEPGVGAVFMDTSAGGGVTLKVTFTAGNDTLRKTVLFQKALPDGTPINEGTLEIYDGVQVNPVDTIQSSAAVLFRRRAGKLAGPF